MLLINPHTPHPIRYFGQYHAVCAVDMLESMGMSDDAARDYCNNPFVGRHTFPISAYNVYVVHWRNVRSFLEELLLDLGLWSECEERHQEALIIFEEMRRLWRDLLWFQWRMVKSGRWKLKAK